MIGLVVTLALSCAAPVDDGDARFAAGTGAGIGSAVGFGAGFVTMYVVVIGLSSAPASPAARPLILVPMAVGAIAGGALGAWTGARWIDVDGIAPASGAAFGTFVGAAPGALLGAYGLVTLNDGGGGSGEFLAGMALLGVGGVAGSIIGAAAATTTSSSSCALPGALP